MIASDLTLHIESFRAMTEQVITLMERMAERASTSGAKISGNLWGKSGATSSAAAAQTTAAMGRVTAASASASTALTNTGQRASGAARGLQGVTASANQASGATATMGQRFASAFTRAGQIGHTLQGISQGVRVVTATFERFRAAKAPVDQATGALKQEAGAAQQAAASNKVTSDSLARVIKNAAAASLAIFGVIKAYRELKSWKPPPLPSPEVGRGAGPSMERSISGSRGSIASSIAGLAGLVAASFAAIQVGKIITDSVKEAAHKETLQVSLSVLVGGDEQAKKVIDDLTARSQKSPYTGSDYTTAGRSLIAFGETADSVGDALDRISDISAGIGASSAGFAEIAEIYGKARVQGQLFAEDINQLTGRGIPIIGQLATILGVTEAQVKKLGSEGQVNFGHLEKAFQNLTAQGGKFFGMSERLSRTSAGMWAILRGKIQLLQQEFGKPIMDALKPILERGIKLADALKERVTAIGQTLGRAIQLIVAAVEELAAAPDWTQSIGVGLKLAFQEAVNVLYGALMGLLAAIGQVLGTAFHLAFASFATDFWSSMLYGLSAFGTALRGMFSLAVAELLEGFSKSGPLGTYLVDDDALKNLRSSGEHLLRKEAPAQWGQAKDDFRDFGKVAAEEFERLFSTIGPNVVAAYKSTDGLFDTTELRVQMESLAKAIQQRAEANKLAAEQRDKEANAKASAAVAPATKANNEDDGKKQHFQPGLFARANNLLFGRSVQEFLLAEAQKQSGLLEKIADNTSKKQSSTPVKNEDAKPIDTVLRYN